MQFGSVKKAILEIGESHVVPSSIRKDCAVPRVVEGWDYWQSGDMYAE